MTAKRGTILGLALSASIIAASLAALCANAYQARARFDDLGALYAKAVELCPSSEAALLDWLRAEDTSDAPENILAAYGYRASDFAERTPVALCAGAGFLCGGLLFLLALWRWQTGTRKRLLALTAELERVNRDESAGLWPTTEDEFSRLQDEMGKTVTALIAEKRAAQAASDRYAQNLANIAHQLKTPLTTLSLCAQMLARNPSNAYLEQLEAQLGRLTRLEEALLMTARIDAGALRLQRRDTDAYTLLMLACDNLRELFDAAGVKLDVPEAEEMPLRVDVEWTMEAVMNLLKNCMEHSERGMTVHGACEQNPLYVRLRLWDEGKGFAKEDEPHLFERFFRGQYAKEGSAGIGLSLAKEIVERQNGILSAYNLPMAGACFEIRFYRH